MDAFDSDVVIYAADPDHPHAAALRALLNPAPVTGPLDTCGSVLLLPEVLSKPQRIGDIKALTDLARVLARLELLPVSEAVARRATALASKYRLKAVDAVHLATAVEVGAERFITNNSKDFSTDIEEVDITYPSMLPVT